MMMSLEQLQGFLEVARLGHFTQAAESLHITQPALSRQISTLEKSLGSELFHRARGNISLTAAGETLLPLARRILADADSIRQEMSELAGLERGRVRLGATPTLCISIVAEAFKTFHQHYPGIELILNERGSRGLLEELSDGALDLALIITSETNEHTPASLKLKPLLSEELVAIGSQGDPRLSGRDEITLAELAQLPQIVLAPTYHLRSYTESAFHTAGLKPTVVLDGAEMDTAMRFVEMGLGVAVVPAMALINKPNLVSLRIIKPRLTRTMTLARRQDVKLTRAAAAMHRTILATADQLAENQDALVSRVG